MNHPLGKPAATAAVSLLSELFTRWKHSESLLALWVEQLARLPITPAQASALVRQHRFARRGNDPDIATYVESARKLLAADREPAAGCSPKQKREEDPDCEYHSFGRWCEILAGDDPAYEGMRRKFAADAPRTFDEWTAMGKRRKGVR